MPSGALSFEALFEHMADAVYVLDPDSSRIVWGNQAAWGSLGLSRDEVLNHSVLSLQVDVTGLPQWSEIAEVIRNTPCFTFIGRHRHAAGHEVEVEVNTTVFVSDEREYFLSVARNIGRRVALDGELNKREKQLSFALNEASDGLWDWDVATGEAFFSPRLKQMLGYGPDEMLPQIATWKSSIHPDDLDRVTAKLNEHLSGKASRYNAEYRLRNRNGDTLWVHDRGRVCARDAMSQPRRVVGMVQDITARKAAEEKAKQLNAYQSLIFGLSSAFINLPLQQIDQAIQDALGKIGRFFGIDRSYVFAYDATTQHIRNSHEWCAPGVPPEIDNLQKIPFDLAPDWIQSHYHGRPIVIDDVNALEDDRPLKALLSAQGIRSLVTLPLMHHDECMGCVGFDSIRTARRFGDEEMRLLGLFADLLTNVTERQRVEHALHENEYRFRSLLENVDRIAVQGYDTNRRVIFWNAASEALYGYTRAEALGKRLEELIVPEPMRDAVIADIASWMSGGPAVPPDEMTLQRKDGSPVTVFSSHVMEILSSGIEMYCIDIDLTERKRIEAELVRYREHLEALVEERTAALSVAKEAAESASRAKSAFLANMSHELRTPMNAIMGLTALALRRAQSPAQHEQLEKVEKASKHLLALIDDILDLSKIEAERLTLEQNDFPLGSVFTNLSSLVEQRASDKGLQFEIDLPRALSEQIVTGDALRLGQVLLNLTSNAIKFTAQGGITVRARAEHSPPGVLALRVEVIDSGIGIDPEAQKHLFTAFEQADNSMTRKYGGTGLGLAICKRLIKLMGGEIKVDSTPARGSNFWFTVSLVKCTGEQPGVTDTLRQCEQQLKRAHAGARLLLVEDEPVNREITLGLLEDTGLQVDVAEDGLAALELAQRTRYDLILMDMQMPRMNGLEATQAIRAAPLNRDTPILAMTANAFDDDRKICLSAGMDDFLSKPVYPEVLFETILRWLNRSITHPQG
ncbi:PAS domain S-box protein [Denitromonas ohlonensis]|uniref:Sensory/regulatory protein RpfC n=2 Tax=Denitromonas TaxID=139331 RepID=A0A557SKJ4_9RHOO|nr:PAS domain S-box protein [Denitromonas ohlonensis]TVO68137.1 PAS domain S-box protein [Denitromonas ohlonensis]TVO77958.1 PAS domain S-box protein [Denitromonas ohlonensis]